MANARTQKKYIESSKLDQSKGAPLDHVLAISNTILGHFSSTIYPVKILLDRDRTERVYNSYKCMFSFLIYIC